MAIINYLPFGGTPAPEKRVKYEYTGVANYTESGTDDWELEFDSSGTFTPYETISVDIFAVGGGGGGSYGPNGNYTSAGGGGGYIFYQRGITLQANQAYSCVIGTGGAGGTSSSPAGKAGGETTFMKGATKLYTASGGQAQQWVNSTYARGGDGGSGGAACIDWSAITANIAAKKRGGENGSYGNSDDSSYACVGRSSWYKSFQNTRKFRSNSGTLYASGGGNGGYNTGTYTIGAGGGGSGAGDGSSVSGMRGGSGSANRGGGGGGGWNSAGGDGGSGIIIIRKAKSFTITAPTDFRINGKTEDQTKESPIIFTWTQGSVSGEDVGPIYHSLLASKGGSYSFSDTLTSPKSYPLTSLATLTDGDVVTYTLYAGNPAVDAQTTGLTVSLTYKDPDTVITAPSSLKIAGSSTHTGETAPLTWTAATVTPSQTITYQIYVDNVLKTSTASTSYTFANLTSTTSAQTIKVRAVAEDGTVSSFSNSVTYYYEEAPSTTITAPSSLKINNTAASSSTVYGSSCSLSWTASTANPSQTITYYIYMGGSNVGTTTSTSYNVSSPSNYTSKTSVYVQAKAADGTWSSSSSTGYFQYAYVSDPQNLKVNGSSSSSSGTSCKLSWSAPATVTPSATVTYRVFVDGSSYASTTSTSYTFASSTVSSWTSQKTFKVDAYTSYATCPGYSNSVTFTYVAPVTDLYLIESKCWANDYNTYAASVNNSTATIGRATADAHVGIYFKFPAPSNWSSVTSLKLHLYRKAGSASGSVTIGAPDVTWTDNLTWGNVYYLSSSHETSGTMAAASSWNTINITGIKSSLQSHAKSGYIVICAHSTSAYMQVDGSTGSYAAWVEVN